MRTSGYTCLVIAVMVATAAADYDISTKPKPKAPVVKNVGSYYSKTSSRDQIAKAALENDNCGTYLLKRPCAKRCTLEWRPVLAKCDNKHVVFINCCSWRRDVCFFKRHCTFIGEIDYKPWEDESHHYY